MDLNRTFHYSFIALIEPFKVHKRFISIEPVWVLIIKWQTAQGKSRYFGEMTGLEQFSKMFINTS